jgi:hypothetical protein
MRALASRITQASYNELTSLTGLSKCSALEHLDVSNNSLKSLRGIERLKSLSSLNVQKCVEHVNTFQLHSYTRRAGPVVPCLPGEITDAPRLMAQLRVPEWHLPTRAERSRRVLTCVSTTARLISLRNYVTARSCPPPHQQQLHARCGVPTRSCNSNTRAGTL